MATVFRWLATAALLLLAACAMPPIDRAMLAEAAGTPVRLETARGPLSYQQSQAILDDLRKRSPEPSIFDRHVAVEESVAGAPLTLGNKAVLLEDGDGAYPAMLAAIRSAKRHIHVQVYIFEEDQTGQEFADALLARAKAGVKVRVIYDSFGSKKTSKEFFEALRKGGVEVLEYHPVDPASMLLKGNNFNQRNHRKLFVVDGRIAFLGGINISEVYAAASGSRSSDVPFDKRAWRDTQLQVEGPVVNDMQKSFVELWEKETKQKLPDADLYPQQKPVGSLAIRAIEGTSDDGPNPLYITFMSAIFSAESKIHMTMAYFVPDTQLIEALKAAARRGVDVRLILPSRTDGWIVFHAGRSFYEDLLESGVKIYERKNRLLHSKYAVIDEVWSTVGSSNLDWRSLLYNLELNAIVLGPEFAQRMETLFEKDLAMSEEITRDKWQGRPLKDRVREAAARMWESML